MWSGSGVQEAPLQVYYGALVFATKQSIVRHLFKGEMPEGVQVKRGLVEDWGPLLQTLEGHTSRVSSVAFSAAGDRLASASHDQTVRVWDEKTGQPLHTLDVYMQWASSVAFSSDGSCLETNRGVMRLPLPAQSTTTLAPQPPAQHILMLWVPANYLPSFTAVHSCRVTFGYSSGRVLFLKLL
ncbi:hypothetical protein HBH53_249210 [Parastagonospora nodorum]|nr:hypothetical protein HBH53_249210 [Parastagonospora nodorum]KAH4223688.1 hypothetical protein HBI05_243920 [Parastagonospora nodorum]KAH4355101.1 hypothetical protein HBH97_240660 [Parastagonospora nodorum]KAH4368712.1 hypothetical protein HBH99_246640 [Parastagonospora nodorum]KAH4891117.1 hypothetical protein HBH74_230570 [Parastagonospora nodorum]